MPKTGRQKNTLMSTAAELTAIEDNSRHRLQCDVMSTRWRQIIVNISEVPRGETSY